ncbi:sigma-54-dependent transcriptional regulator [Agaribacterium haliotis]|uniref:sigma-54-dependent transcriptional regulator n=1 Tax=Agaribacterium haliotis TaxID=2013869 RepID=UPI000BB58EF3|nr:sigma-54 dependent transcriptional regulator [Agaribacterium haliotis]
MSHIPKLLLVEDSPSLSEVYKQYLKKERIHLFSASNGSDAISLAKAQSPDLVLLDLKLPDIPGEQVLTEIKKALPQCCVIVITAHGNVDIAVELMRLGAHDFLQKPIDATRLLTTVRNNIENLTLRALVSNLSGSYQRKGFHGFVGNCAPMQAVYRIIESAAASKATIFITGESGTGKEVCAEAIHKQSPRNSGAFIALNCGAIPKDLMESEIFGHVKGAFTGAASERKGAATLADGGTLFLDEIGEMDLELQTKLLRFIQSGSVKKVGSSKEERVDVRFICATNRDPLEQIVRGEFREDLYYRLNVVPIHLPALRERDDDINLLSEHFLRLYAKEDGKQFESLSSEVKTRFNNYDWPGNVRQLQNIIRNIVVLNDAQSVELQHLPMPFKQSQNEPPAEPQGLTANEQAEAVQRSAVNGAQTNPQTSGVRPLAIVEREIIEHAILHCHGNIPQAAALLKVSPSTIYRKKQNWH